MVILLGSLMNPTINTSFDVEISTSHLLSGENCIALIPIVEMVSGIETFEIRNI